MQDDFTVFWHNNDHAYELFYDLLARAKKAAYDDNFLAQLAAYRAESPESEKADIFAAQYLLHHGDVENAVICGERAYAKRPLNHEVLKLLAVAYKTLHREMDSIDMQGRAHGLYGSPQPALNLTPPDFQEGLDRFSFARNSCFYAPTATARAYIGNGQLLFRPDIFIGEELPLTMPKGSARFWSAAYVESGYLSDHSYMLAALRHTDAFTRCEHHTFYFDLQKANEVRGTVTIQVQAGDEVILPIAGTEVNQPLSVQAGSNEPQKVHLGKWAFSFFRLNEDTILHSNADTPYAVGTPIRLGHSPKRRKIVLNLFLDSLSWTAMRPYAETHLPNTMRFFSRGTIFDQHFSTSEYTLPAQPAIETGYYPHHTQIFNIKAGYELPLTMPTIAERMKDLGYYCAAPMAPTQGISHGMLRGFDRAIVSSWVLNTAFGVDSVIRHLRAFDEVDQYLSLVTLDIHPYNAFGFKFDTAVETHLPLAERFLSHDAATASVRLPRLRIYQEQYLERLQQVDRNLELLYSYLEENYTEDEYLVTLYSDHGIAIFGSTATGSIDVISEGSTSATWMMRGAGVPTGVTVHDLTSSVDIYPTLGHLCDFPVANDIDGRLPAIFGGTARDAVYTASQYPGQSYKLAIRTHDHTLRLETQEAVGEDGTVDFMITRTGIYPRGHEWEKEYEIDSTQLREFFYPRARDFVREIANNGEVFA